MNYTLSSLQVQNNTGVNTTTITGELMMTTIEESLKSGEVHRNYDCTLYELGEIFSFQQMKT